ncbi:MAG: hypothetical protein RL693_2727 [Verrucomicrobiota bacterium]
MICLDTNYLIKALLPGSNEAEAVLNWLRQGVTLSTSSVAWYEFVCGPVKASEIEMVRSLLAGGVLPFGDAEARAAARLFNAVHRSRRFRVDAMIAASSMVNGAALATDNTADFKAFVPHGLKLL